MWTKSIHEDITEAAYKKAVKKLFRKKKISKGKIAKQLGIGLHTIQDFYAHNVNYKGKVVSSRKVANDKFKEKKGKLIAGKYSKFISDSFITICNNGYKKIKVGTKVHSTTADNPYAYFDGQAWQINMSKYSSRYKKAIKYSMKYLKLFAKKKVKVLL